jgi:autotransporter passenger strand-loop-strand repeat protein
MTTFTVSSGQTSIGLTLNSQDIMDVLSGGVAVDTRVNLGGFMQVLDGGFVQQTTLFGVALIRGGSASNTIVENGGFAEVGDGAVTSSTIVKSGGEEDVFGLAVSTTVQKGGVQNVQTDPSTGDIATASGTTVFGTAIAGVQAEVNNASVKAGGLLIVQQAAIAFSATISRGGIANISGSTETNLISGEEIVFDGGFDEGSTVQDGGKVLVSSGGFAEFDGVSSGGLESVLGLDSFGTVLSGGTLVVSSGGKTSGTTVSSGGREFVSSGGVAIITSGAPVFGLMARGGTVTVSEGGRTDDAVIGSGGELVVSEGVVASTTVQKGGVEELLKEAESISTIIFGAEIVAGAGALADGASVKAGGVLTVEDLVSATGATISKGGIADISGTDTSAVIRGGQEIVFAGGVDLDGTVVDGGKMVISSGGTTTASVVSSGGELVINGFGSASGTVVSNGGFEIVGFDGSASGTTLLSGARATVLSGGFDSAADVDSGSLETVLSGGVARSAVISGGTLDIKSGGSTIPTSVGAMNNAATVTFATSGGGTLLLESSLTFSGLVAGFGKPDRLDFRDIGFTSGVTSATWTQNFTNRGTLAVTSGTETADITLLGQYVTADFRVSTDGHGGTFVTDPPAKTETDVQNVALVNPHQT